MFQQLKWLPLEFRQVSLVYKAVNGNAPQYIQTMFTNIKDYSNYSLRSSANKKNDSFPEHNINPFHTQA